MVTTNLQVARLRDCDPTESLGHACLRAPTCKVYLLHVLPAPRRSSRAAVSSHQVSKVRRTFCKKAIRLFGSGMIHIVMGEIIASNPMARHRTHQVFHHPLGRVAKQETDGASGAISADGSELSQLLQIGHYCAVGADVETHSRNEDAVEETLQDRGKPLVPNRIDQDESSAASKRSA